MREILFRGKRIEDGKWIYGYYLDRKTSMADFPCIALFRGDAYDDDNDWEVDIETVGQYTGLTDKNGKKIFEGDIIQSVESGETGEIQYFPEHAAFLIFVRGSNSCLDYLGEVKPSILKVIGNIHDNFELLNK